jgi:hypothetical protein
MRPAARASGERVEGGDAVYRDIPGVMRDERHAVPPSRGAEQVVHRMDMSS